MTTRNVLTMPTDDAEAAAWRGLSYTVTDPAEWADTLPPEQEWTVKGWLPKKRAAYLTGAGGAGKSLLTQHLATCIGLGLPFLGLETTRGPAIYVTAEDDLPELRRRQRAICASLGVSERDLSGRLHLLSLFGLPDNQMLDFGPDGQMRTLAALHLLENTFKEVWASFVVLDNVSHLFGGNEINRAQVTAFANVLNRISNDLDGTVLLVGHPNKQGDHYSGSTAWENAFRARLYFDAPKGDNVHTDPDLRELSLPKANYAAKGAKIEVRWHQGAFVREDELPAGALASTREISTAVAENKAFLRCLDKATTDRRAVSHVPGVNYAPKIFAQMIEGKKHDEKAFARALERLLHLGQIELDKPLWKDQFRKWKNGIRQVEAGAATPAVTPAATPCGDPAATPSETGGNACGDPAALVRRPHTIPYGDIGRGPEGPPVLSPWAPPADDELDWREDDGEGDQ